MARFEFAATHGVRFPEGKFEPVPDSGADPKRYRCVVTDAAAAKRLRALAKAGAYGIEEVRPVVDGDDDG